MVPLKTVMLVLAIFGGVAQAASCQTTLRLGLGQIWPPYYVEPQGKVDGIDIRIARHVFEQAEVCLHVVKQPSSNRSLTELARGNIDLLLAASYTAEREVYAHYSSPYRQESIRIFWFPKGRKALAKLDLQGLLDAGLKGAFNRGSYLGIDAELLKRAVDKKQLLPVSNLPQRVTMLRRHRVDFVIEDQNVGLQVFKQDNQLAVEMHPYVVHSNEVSMLFSRKSVNQALVERLSTIIEADKAQIAHIISSY